MNKSVNPILALAIILLFGGTFGLYYHFLKQASDAPKTHYLKNGIRNNIIIRHGADFYDYTQDGQFNQVFHLADIGVSSNLGDFDLFQNGDILIQANYDGITELQRCDMILKDCRQFSAELGQLSRVHHISIDRNTDTVIITDTEKHRIHKLNADGILLATLDSELRYPNQAWQEGNHLWILDSNHYVIKESESNDNTFGSLISAHEPKEHNEQRWPSAHVKVGDIHWLNVADSIMGQARTVLFNSSWERIKTIALPSDVDPVDLLFTGKSVLIIDPNKEVIYQFDLDGSRIENFAENDTHPESIFTGFQQSNEVEEKYTRWSSYTLWSTAGLFILLFIYALWQLRKEEIILREFSLSPEAQTRLNMLPENGYWVDVSKNLKLIPYLMFAIAIICPAYLLFMSFPLPLFENKNSYLSLWGLILVNSLLYSGLGIYSLKKSQPKLGFFKGHVRYQKNKNKIYSQSYDQIKWHEKGAFFIEDQMISSKRFPNREIQTRLIPYLRYTHNLSHKELQKLIWKNLPLFQKILIGLFLVFCLVRFIMDFTN